jgi:hypothetical protein
MEYPPPVETEMVYEEEESDPGRQGNSAPIQWLSIYRARFENIPTI